MSTHFVSLSTTTSPLMQCSALSVPEALTSNASAIENVSLDKIKEANVPKGSSRMRIPEYLASSYEICHLLAQANRSGGDKKVKEVHSSIIENGLKAAAQMHGLKLPESI